ncbi:terminase small subunit [Entomohabitans teleogrylli]|uniref:terminase small subunit n=1 Tax=Entomohabitans teleogrylli TaxID=1384589 RepID=UPI00073D762C|nr:terminase small subunit [Entomohabitans teleogrylli]
MFTGQKRRFALALMSGSSQAEAARQAGYSEKTARSQGSRLAKDPDIVAFIRKKGRAGQEEEKPQEDVTAKNAAELPASHGVQQSPGDGVMKKYDDPLDFLRAVMNDAAEDIDTRKDAAKAMLPYVHTKKGEGGKKDARNAAAKVAASASKFGALAPPKLVVNNKG